MGMRERSSVPRPRLQLATIAVCCEGPISTALIVFIVLCRSTGTMLGRGIQVVLLAIRQSGPVPTKVIASTLRHRAIKADPLSNSMTVAVVPSLPRPSSSTMRSAAMEVGARRET